MCFFKITTIHLKLDLCVILMGFLELINLLLSRCPSLFLSKNNSFKDSIDCSILLRTKACPVSTTTLYSEFRAVPNMMQYIESKDFNQQQMKQQPKTIDSLDFSLFVRCCELASTVINEFGLEKQLCAECHMLITCLVKFVTEATDGYHKAEIGFGFEDGFVYSSSKARKDPEHIDANGSTSSSVAVRNIRQPNLISNALLWRAALALETIYKLTQSSQLIHFLHFDAQQLNDTLIPALAARVSDFAIITASNEASIRNTISSARRTALVRNDSNKITYYTCMPMGRSRHSKCRHGFIQCASTSDRYAYRIPCRCATGQSVTKVRISNFTPFSMSAIM